MSISGACGLIRNAHNPDCELQAAMVAERVKEPEFYRRLTGQDYPGEYGERVSARRRGTQFESHLHRDKPHFFGKRWRPSTASIQTA
jgi:hypothetical protein